MCCWRASGGQRTSCGDTQGPCLCHPQAAGSAGGCPQVSRDGTVDPGRGQSLSPLTCRLPGPACPGLSSSSPCPGPGPGHTRPHRSLWFHLPTLSSSPPLASLVSSCPCLSASLWLSGSLDLSVSVSLHLSVSLALLRSSVCLCVSVCLSLSVCFSLSGCLPLPLSVCASPLRLSSS